jgi:hypothetical protein
LTFVFRALKTPAGTDATEPSDYFSDSASAEVIAEAEREISGREERSTRPG